MIHLELVWECGISIGQSSLLPMDILWTQHQLLKTLPWRAFSFYSEPWIDSWMTRECHVFLSRLKSSWQKPNHSIILIITIAIHCSTKLPHNPCFAFFFHHIPVYYGWLIFVKPLLPEIKTTHMLPKWGSFSCITSKRSRFRILLWGFSFNGHFW